MFTNHLEGASIPKFILIEDNLRHRSVNILRYLINVHLRRRNTIHLLNFERNSPLVRDYSDKVVVHNRTTDKSSANLNLLQASDTPLNVIIVDSLQHAIYRYGFENTYETLNGWLRGNVVLQVVFIFHRDAVQNTTLPFNNFKRLDTLSVCLFPKFDESKNARFSYRLSKSGGRIIRNVEDYKFENETLICENVKTVPFVQEKNEKPLPENLTTFKISLQDKEKESRDKLILPFMPEANTKNKDVSDISYKFDSIDDWDEEDPDDDLDI